MGYDGSVKIGTELDKSGLQNGLSGLGSFAKKGFGVLGSAAASAAKVATAAVAGVTAAFTAVTKSALDAVASMEQNVGGIETLFKGSADTVIKAANNAYKTAGMSANDYMSTVTSFSASLLQGLAGDTEKAAQISDMAITDMSDNANKMGTSMESIQNAYQGFAKQNYTMLDNLKLGYGGTKTEMERLLKDAQKLSGVEYDISNLSDVYSAIHVIQEEMGITGTTAKEAATTIEGSMTSAKAAWENFLAGVTSPEELVNSFATAGAVVIDNLSEIIPRLAATIPAAVKLIANGISENSGQIISTAKNLITDMGSGIVEAAPAFAEKGLSIINSLKEKVVSAVPLLWDAGLQLIQQIGLGLEQAIPELLSKALPLAAEFSANLKTAAGQLIDAGIDLILNIVDGLVAALPDLIAYVPTIITNIADILNENIPKLLACGVSIIGKIIGGIVQNIPNLIANFPKIVNSILAVLSAVNWASAGGKIVSGIAGGIKSLASTAINAVKNVGQNGFKTFQNIDWISLGTGLIRKIVSGIGSMLSSIPSKLKSIGQTAMSAFKGLSWSSVGSNIISGITSGISAAAGGLVRSAVNAASSALNAVKSWLGIHSPSRRARDEIGVNMIAGVGEGVEKETPNLAAEAEDSMKTTVGAMKKASASEFVTKMQARSYQMADNNEMSARNKYQNSGYEPDEPDDDQVIYIHNEFDVNGKKMEENIVKKTKKEIQKEQRANQAVKGDVAFA